MQGRNQEFGTASCTDQPPPSETAELFGPVDQHRMACPDRVRELSSRRAPGLAARPRKPNYHRVGMEDSREILQQCRLAASLRTDDCGPPSEFDKSSYQNLL